MRIARDITQFADQGDPLVQQFHKLRNAALDKHKAERKVVVDAEQAKAAAKVASEKVALAYAGGAPQAKLDKLEAELVEANALAGKPWKERIEGARQAAQSAADALGVFIAAHGDELLALIAPAALALPARAQQIRALVDEWLADRQQIDSQVTELVAFMPGVIPRDVLPVWVAPGGLSDVLRELEDAPLPLPSRTGPEEPLRRQEVAA